LQMPPKKGKRKANSPAKGKGKGKKGKTGDDSSSSSKDTVVAGPAKAMKDSGVAVVLDEEAKAGIKQEGLFPYLDKHRVGIEELEDRLLTVSKDYLVRPVEEEHVVDLMKSIKKTGMAWKDNFTAIVVERPPVPPHLASKAEEDDDDNVDRFVLDGVHRHEARRRLFNEAAEMEEHSAEQIKLLNKLGTKIPVVLYKGVPVSVCNLYSATVNDMQTMGKGQSMMDAMYGLHQSIKRLTNVGVLSAKKDYQGQKIVKNLPVIQGSQDLRLIADVFYRIASVQTVRPESFREHYHVVVGAWVQCLAALAKYPPGDVRPLLMKLVKKAKMQDVDCFKPISSDNRTQWLPDPTTLSRFVFVKQRLQRDWKDEPVGKYVFFLRLAALVLFRYLVAKHRKMGTDEAKHADVIIHDACNDLEDLAKDVADAIRLVDAMEEKDTSTPPMKDPSYYCALRLAFLPAYDEAAPKFPEESEGYTHRS